MKSEFAKRIIKQPMIIKATTAKYITRCVMTLSHFLSLTFKSID